MASDREVFVAMLDRAGVKWRIDDGESELVHIYADDGPKNIGYSGFGATFSFSVTDGSLDSVGVWE